jgi:hypothetical protein
MTMANKDIFKVAKTQHGRVVPIAISHQALLDKSKLFAKRSIDAKESNLDSECQLWAAGALELLAKAQLAAVHPCLVVETENTNSLLEACGVVTSTKVRTINASVAYARLNHTVAHFSTPVMEGCKELANRRNAELHSGEAACAGMPYDAWEGDFWNAADLILQSMDMDLKEWLGADAKAPTALLKAHRNAEVRAAKQRVKHYASEFKKSEKGKLGRDKIKAFLAATYNAPTNKGLFRYEYSEYWKDECPACKACGFVAGDLSWEDKAEDQDQADYGEEVIERGYTATEFHCPTCGLALIGGVAIHAADMDEEHIEVSVEEISYEPEYGND